MELSDYNRENRFIVEKEGKIKCLKVLWLFSAFVYNGKLIKSKLVKNFQMNSDYYQKDILALVFKGDIP